MGELQIENVVATGDLDTRINFTDVIDSVDLPHVRYDPDIHQGLELRFVEEGPLITIYATGKYIIRASSVRLLYDTRDSVLKLLSDIGVIRNPNDVSFEINNVVGSGSIGREVALEPLANDLDIGETKYDPENFPALRCKMLKHSTTVLLYRSGKVIITGATSVDEAEAAYNEFKMTLQSLFELDT